MSYTVKITRSESYQDERKEWVVLSTDRDGSSQHGYAPTQPITRTREVEVLSVTLEQVNVDAVVLALFPGVKP